MCGWNWPQWSPTHISTVPFNYQQGGWQGGEGEGVGYYMVVDKAHITLGLGPAGTSLAFLPTQGKQVHYHPHTQHTNTTHTGTHIRKHTNTRTTTKTHRHAHNWILFNGRYFTTTGNTTNSTPIRKLAKCTFVLKRYDTVFTSSGLVLCQIAVHNWSGAYVSATAA